MLSGEIVILKYWPRLESTIRTLNFYRTILNCRIPKTYFSAMNKAPSCTWAEFCFFHFSFSFVVFTRFNLQLDYIPRLMWQGQIKGNKTWNLAPIPECDHVCKPFTFYVEPGDAGIDLLIVSFTSITHWIHSSICFSSVGYPNMVPRHKHTVWTVFSYGTIRIWLDISNHSNI